MTLSFSPPIRQGHIVRLRHRRVGFAEWGSPDGTPVVFCTGAAMTSSFAVADEVLEALRIRLICIDRAGLGRSTPDEDKSVATYVADVDAVLRELRIARPRLLGLSQGAVFAVALAGAGHASALALVSAGDEVAHPFMRDRVHPDVLHMIHAIEADRADFEAEFARRVDAEGMWSLVLGMSAVSDRAIYEATEFSAAYRRTLGEGFAQGPHGYVRDLTLSMSRWPTQPESVSVPVALWYGLRDTSPVHSPDFGLSLSQRFPHATLHRLPDEGGSLLWTRTHEILADLLRL